MPAAKGSARTPLGPKLATRVACTCEAVSGKDGCSLSPTVDGSGVGHGKVDGCGQGRAEQHCTLMHSADMVDRGVLT
jgi:hypothetical protein